MVDYHGERTLPDTPARPRVLYVRLGADEKPEIRTGPELPPWQAGEAPGRRPHRPVLKLQVASRENFSRDAERLNAPVSVLEYDCGTETDFDALRIPTVRWNGMALPDEAASRGIDRSATPAIYTFYMNLVFAPPRQPTLPVPALDFLHAPQDICLEITVQNRFGDRVHTETLRLPRATIAAAVRACHLPQCRPAKP